MPTTRHPKKVVREELPSLTAAPIGPSAQLDRAFESVFPYTVNVGRGRSVVPVPVGRIFNVSGPERSFDPMGALSAVTSVWPFGAKSAALPLLGVPTRTSASDLVRAAIEKYDEPLLREVGGAPEGLRRFVGKAFHAMGEHATRERLPRRGEARWFNIGMRPHAAIWRALDRGPLGVVTKSKGKTGLSTGPGNGFRLYEGDVTIDVPTHTTYLGQRGTPYEPVPDVTANSLWASADALKALSRRGGSGFFYSNAVEDPGVLSALVRRGAFTPRGVAIFKVPPSDIERAALRNELKWLGSEKLVEGPSYKLPQGLDPQMEKALKHWVDALKKQETNDQFVVWMQKQLEKAAGR